jgi:hypothetical protein
MDHGQMHQVLDGEKPFDERTMVDEEEQEAPRPAAGNQPPPVTNRLCAR